MGQAQSALDFKLLSLTFALRDRLFPRITILNEVGIAPGSVVLDYGCGPGGYIVPLASLVGSTGTIYAQDMDPRALRSVEAIAERHGLKQVQTIQSDCKTGLPDVSVDVVLLYDIVHHLHDPDAIMEELYRVLRPDGILSFSDHHMKERDIASYFSRHNLFAIRERHKKTCTLTKVIYGSDVHR